MDEPEDKWYQTYFEMWITICRLIPLAEKTEIHERMIHQYYWEFDKGYE